MFLHLEKGDAVGEKLDVVLSLLARNARPHQLVGGATVLVDLAVVALCLIVGLLLVFRGATYVLVVLLGDLRWGLVRMEVAVGLLWKLFKLKALPF